MKTPHTHLNLHSGFTLVELLVAITIMIVIATLAFFGMQSARASADLTVSMNRIKGLGVANAAYAADHNGRYVPIITTDDDGMAGVQWHFNTEFLSALTGGLEMLEGVVGYEGADGIPEEILDPVTVRAKKRYWDRLSGSYGHNEECLPGGFTWGAKGQKAQQSIMTIRNPSRTFNFITATDWLVRFGDRYNWLKKPIEGKTENGQIAYRHEGKAIAVFYDGHTEVISPSDMRGFDARGGINNGFWGGTR